MKKFEATDEQRQLALYGLSLGISADYVRLDIVNPQTKKPIDLDIFCREFKDEIHAARYAKVKEVVSVIYKKATIDEDLGACAKFLSLNARGCFNKRWDYDPSASANAKVDSIIKACADGYLGCMEANELINGISKGFTAIEFEEIKREFLAIKVENYKLKQLVEAK